MITDHCFALSRNFDGISAAGGRGGRSSTGSVSAGAVRAMKIVLRRGKDKRRRDVMVVNEQVEAVLVISPARDLWIAVMTQQENGVGTIAEIDPHLRHLLSILA